MALLLFLVVQTSNLGGVYADGFHVVKDKVNLGELRAYCGCEVVLYAPEDSLGSRLLGEVVTAGLDGREGGEREG